MTKNIILSIVVIGAVVTGGYYIFGGKSTPANQEVSLVSTDSYGLGDTTVGLATSTNDVATTSAITNNKPAFAASSSVARKTHMVTIETNYGKIVFETYNADAPNTVNNFVTLAGKGFYDNLIFHRVIEGFMIQGGDPQGDGRGGPGYKFDDELNPNTASYKAGYKKGVVAMANAGPNTNGSQFFIMLEDYPLPNNYTIFGKVVSGQEVVDKIGKVQTGAGDKPVTPVVMNKVRVN